MYNSFTFLIEQAFFIASAATETIALFTLRADCGQFTTQRIHEMHFLRSVTFTFSLLIACAGQFSAHSLQFVHVLSTFGIKPTPTIFLYGYFPGIFRVDVSATPQFIFSRIFCAKTYKSCLSLASGLPAAYWCIIECSAIAATPTITWKPFLLQYHSIQSMYPHRPGFHIRRQ